MKRVSEYGRQKRRVSDHGKQSFSTRGETINIVRAKVENSLYVK